jgi:hypothetical protein
MLVTPARSPPKQHSTVSATDPGLIRLTEGQPSVLLEWTRGVVQDKQHRSSSIERSTWNRDE